MECLHSQEKKNEIIKDQKKQIDDLRTKSDTLQQSVNDLKDINRDKSVLLESEQDKTKKAQRGKRWALIGNATLSGLLLWSFLKP